MGEEGEKEKNGIQKKRTKPPWPIRHLSSVGLAGRVNCVWPNANARLCVTHRFPYPFTSICKPLNANNFPTQSKLIRCLKRGECWNTCQTEQGCSEEKTEITKSVGEKAGWRW